MFVLPRVRLLTLLTVSSAAALFSRRRTGWLDELDDIRHDALEIPGGEVAVAMSDVEPLVPVGGEPSAWADDERSPLADLEPSMARQSVEPAPHPVRPHEMWHPGVVSGPVDGLPAPLPEVESERHLEEEARLAPAAAVEAPFAPAMPPPAISELFDAAKREDRATIPPGFGDAPLVPPSSTFGAGSLIDGPVPRRDRRERPSLGHRTIEAEAVELAAIVAAVVGRDVAAPAAAPAAPAPRSAAPAAPAPRSAAPAPALPPAPTGPPAPQLLEVQPDGLIEVQQGVLRLSDDCRPAVHVADTEVAFEVNRGWCWSSLPVGAHQSVALTLPVGLLTVGGGTTALASVDADGSTFVVVVSGEAVLRHPGGRMRLRSGAMALTPRDAEPQADVASADEIAADALVRHNLELDAAT